MTYDTYLYKPNPKKLRADRLDVFYIAATVVGLILVYAFFIRGFLAIGFLVSIAAGMISLKVNDIKKKGANRFGSLTEKISISPERLVVGDGEFTIADVENFEIVADDFLGRPTDFFGTSGGVDNYFEFTRNGVEYSFPFQVKRKGDLKILFEIEKEIKERK